MEVSEQLRRWRDFMAQVYTGMSEISECQSKDNQAKMSVVLEYLAASALRCQADLEQSTGLPPARSELPLDCLHDTEANERYLSALQLAMHASYEVNEEKGDDYTPASHVLVALIADVERKISGPALYDEGPSLLVEEDENPALNAGLFGESLFDIED